MPESTKVCSFSFHQQDWEEKNGTAQEWESICDRLELDDGAWHCPHDAIAGTDFERCVFHIEPGSVPRNIDENERFRDAITTATEESDRSAQFLGAQFDEIKIDSIDPGCTIDLCGATVAGSLSISTTIPRTLYANRTVFRGQVSIDGSTENVNFENTVWDHRADFTSSEFGGNLLCSGATFNREVTFRRATITGRAEFTGVEFNCQADFFNCHFQSQAVFNGGVRFNTDALFQDAFFDDTTDFEEAIFQDEANFSAPSKDPTPQFGGEIIFKNAEFCAEANFDRRQFDADANFADVTFCGDAVFDETSFRGPARFLHAEFIGEKKNVEASFQQVVFNETADFERAEFLVSTRFSEANFHDVTLFRNVTFGAKVDFSKPDPADVDRWEPERQNVNFHERTIFNQSTFGCSADFSDIEFKAPVEFRNTKFNDETTFDRTEYESKSDFVGATFKAPVSFHESRFDSDVRFRETGQFKVVFSLPPDFSQADLSGTDLRDAPLQNADFTGTDMTETNLQGANLSGARLEGALLNRANCFGTVFEGAALKGAVMGDARIDSQTEFGFASSKAAGSNGYCAYDPRHLPAEQAIDSTETSLSAAISTYQLIEQLAADNGLDRLQSEAFVRQQDIRTREKAHEAKQAESIKKRLRALFGWLLQIVSRVVMYYGERPKRVVVWWLGSIIGFSLLNIAAGLKPPEGGRLTLSQFIGDPSLISDLLYYTALGFAGISIDTLTPAGSWARVTAIVTALVGAILISLFVFALGRKTSR